MVSRADVTDKKQPSELIPNTARPFARGMAGAHGQRPHGPRVEVQMYKSIKNAVQCSASAPLTLRSLGRVVSIKAPCLYFGNKLRVVALIMSTEIMYLGPIAAPKYTYPARLGNVLTNRQC